MMPWTTTDLYRRGNAASPRLTYVRLGKDVEVFVRGNVNWVQAESGGVSTFSSPGLGSPWWILPAGSEYPDELVVVNDHGNHFSWEPRFEMPLTDFLANLATVESAFRKLAD